MYSNININDPNAPAATGTEMASTVSHHHQTSDHAREEDNDLSSYYSTDEEVDMAGVEDETDTQRLLRAQNYPSQNNNFLPVPSGTSATSLYPQLPYEHQTAASVPPLAASVVSNLGHRQHNTNYGSVTSSLPSSGRNNQKIKRYRLPLLILLVFDCGLVIFLSIICYDSKKSGLDEAIPKLSYFTLEMKRNFFDLVLLGMLRLLLNALLYLLMAWVNRSVMAITTVVSAIYVPWKAFYCWPLTNSDSDDGEFQAVPILLILFVSFVMPWVEAFFFEFKDTSLFRSIESVPMVSCSDQDTVHYLCFCPKQFLPAELSRLTSTSWKRWEFWLWPRALVRPDINDPPSLPNMATHPPQRPDVLTTHVYPHTRHYAASTVSLDFRTPMGSTRNSPIPAHMLYGERSCNPPDDDLPPILEEASPQTLSEEDQQYKMEGVRVLQQMLEFTAGNESWKFEKTTNNVSFHSRTWQGKKIWKAESEMMLSALQLWNILYPGDLMPQWNPQCTKNEAIYKIDDETDIVYSVTSALGPVSSRDFVSLRQISTNDEWYISASTATVYDGRPPQSGKVRGENGPCGYKVIPAGDDHCIFIWILNTDLKGWMPQSVIDQTLCNVMTTTFKKLQQFIEQRRSEGRL